MKCPPSPIECSLFGFLILATINTLYPSDWVTNVTIFTVVWIIFVSAFLFNVIHEKSTQVTNYNPKKAVQYFTASLISIDITTYLLVGAGHYIVGVFYGGTATAMLLRMRKYQQQQEQACQHHPITKRKLP